MSSQRRRSRRLHLGKENGKRKVNSRCDRSQTSQATFQDPPETTDSDHHQNLAERSPVSKTPRLHSPPKATSSCQDGTLQQRGDKSTSKGTKITSKNRFVVPLKVNNLLSNSNAMTANQYQSTQSNQHFQFREMFQSAPPDQGGQSSSGEAPPREPLITAGSSVTEDRTGGSPINLVVSPIKVSISRKQLRFNDIVEEIPSTSSRSMLNDSLDEDSESGSILNSSLTGSENEDQGGGELEQDQESGTEAEGERQPEVGAEDVPGQGRKRLKRRIRQPISRARLQRKISRNSGEEYVNAKGKLVEEKIPIPLPAECRSGCSLKLSPEVCQALCKDLWKGLADQNRRSSYIANLVEVKPKATLRLDPNVEPKDRKNRNYSNFYHVIVNGQNISVCKGCFLKIFRVSSKFVDLAVRKKLSTTGGIVANDARGRASNPLDEDRRNEVKSFFNKIPKYKSHYARNQTNNEFLPSHLTLKVIYEQYCSEVALPNKPVSRWIFEREFNEMGLKIKQRKVDTCHTCDKLDAAVTYSKNGEERKQNEEILDQHHQKWETARDKKRADKVSARQDKTRLRTVAFDLQQCLPTPMLETSVIFYKRQLWTYNLTIHDCASKDSTHNMWHEGEGERGPNQIGSALYHYIMALPDSVEELILWSDTCGGQNKNSIIAAALTTALLHKPTLSKIEQKFLVPGHTHLECDTDHSTIEGCKRNARGVHLPRDWMTLVRNASRKFSVFHLKTESQLDFKALLKGRSSPLVKRKKDTAKNIFSWKAVVWMRHEKGRPGIIAYKTTHDEEAPFAFLDIRRKRNVAVTLSPEKAYSEPLPISHKKKEDLVSLLYLIDPECAPFYLNLKSDGDDDFDPDLLPDTDQEESEGEDC